MNACFTAEKPSFKSAEVIIEQLLPFLNKQPQPIRTFNPTIPDQLTPPPPYQTSCFLFLREYQHLSLIRDEAP